MSSGENKKEVNEMSEMITLRAEVAMRAEDLRIARKHREEAAARVMSPANERAYKSALRWEATCAEREQKARGALIRASLEVA